MGLNQQLFKNLIKKYDGIREETAKAVAETARDYYLEQFDSGGWEGSKWKLKKDGSPATLVDTGKLRSDIENCIKETGVNNIVLRVDTPYAPYLKNGTDSMPARLFFVKSYRLIEKITEIFEKGLGKL